MDSFTIATRYDQSLIPNVHPIHFVFTSVLLLLLYCCLKDRTPNLRQRQRAYSTSMV